ncbi:MAG TPA: fumarylacetoacetate hydrolase family protein [Mycobacteriales bacterium]|nr:fumarylacetoacetate hydrolase family protein [Mycobacteriales bacterium]
MKLVSYVADGTERVGVLDATDIVFQIDGDPGGGGLVGVIEHILRHGPDSVRTRPEPAPASALAITAPVPRPARNIFCVGKNYRAHVGELSRSGYGFGPADAEEPPGGPTFFTKPASSVIGPGEPIDDHSGLTSALDYEAELAVIIGPGGRSISTARAWEHVWGYTLINDVTARDIQRDRGQWFLGKSLDTFCPMGPWAVGRDELNLADVTLECWVNGEQRQSAGIKELIFDIPTLIADLSAGVTLRTGDIIATGTPSGVGLGFDPPRFLVPGDLVRVTATGLGVLENRVGRG